MVFTGVIVVPVSLFGPLSNCLFRADTETNPSSSPAVAMPPCTEARPIALAFSGLEGTLGGGSLVERTLTVTPPNLWVVSLGCDMSAGGGGRSCSLLGDAVPEPK